MKGIAVRLARPGVFLGFGPGVCVTSNGELFYSFSKSGPFTFTLPVGSYEVSGATFLADMQPSPRLSFDDAGVKIPARIRVVFRPNPNKCSINLDRALIVCDPSFQELPRVCLTYVLFHEIGHFWYNDPKDAQEALRNEELCDAFAAREMLARGWNPSQIASASELTLSLCSQDRKDQQWNTMKHYRHV